MTTVEVTSSDKLVHELTVATDASIGVIAIRCPETEVYRVVDELYAIAMSSPNKVFRLHTSETGWCEYAVIEPENTRAPAFDPLDPANSDKGTADVGKAFEGLFNAGKNPNTSMPTSGIFVMLDLYQTFTEPRTHTRIRKQVQRSLECEQRLFLVVPNSAEIPDELSPLMHVIEFGYPTRTELRQSLLDLLGDNLEETDMPELTDEEIDTIVSNGQGMTLNNYETAISVAITSFIADNETLDGFGAEDITKSIRNYKMQLLRKTNVLELQTAVPETDIGGLDLFKQWMHQRKATYTDRALEHNVTPSRGAMVLGPPGTGKSLVAKAAGSILNLPVLRFDIGRVFGSYVGQSETTMRTVLALIDAMAPCVLMVDEIDKGFAGMAGGGSNDNGTASRVFGTFLTWMQERDQTHRPVFLILTANRIDGLPPELLRKGRIDEIWSVNMPNRDEREAIAKIHLSKRNQDVSVADLKEIVRITDALVGAEIEALIEDALVLSLSGEKPGVTFEYVEQSFEHLKPMSKTRAEEFKRMQSWADENARSASGHAVQSIASGTRKKLGKRKGRVKATVKREE